MLVQLEEEGAGGREAEYECSISSFNSKDLGPFSSCSTSSCADSEGPLD